MFVLLLVFRAAVARRGPLRSRQHRSARSSTRQKTAAAGKKAKTHCAEFSRMYFIDLMGVREEGMDF